MANKKAPSTSPGKKTLATSSKEKPLRPEGTGGKPGQPRTDSGGRTTMLSEDVPAAPNIDNFQADQITIYGIKLNLEEEEPKLQFAKLWLAVKVVNSKNKVQDKNMITIAVAYGYAFEGHCYRLDRPKLLIFEHEDDNPAEGCGFGGDYRMWRVRSKSELLEISLSVDLAERLILEANLPGNRAPNTYGNSMQLAHRSGRIGK